MCSKSLKATFKEIIFAELKYFIKIMIEALFANNAAIYACQEKYISFYDYTES